MLTPYPARNNPIGLPSLKVPNILGFKLNSCNEMVVWEITTANAAIALNPLSPGKYIVLLFTYKVC